MADLAALGKVRVWAAYADIACSVLPSRLHALSVWSGSDAQGASGWMRARCTSSLTGPGV